jgi:hypothetical protein
MDGVLFRPVCERAGVLNMYLVLRVSVFFVFLTYPRTVFLR